MPLPPEILHLRLVPPAPAECLPERPPIRLSYHPNSTPSPDPYQLVFLNTELLNGHHFNDLLTTVRPSFLIDVRVVPRFDYLGTSRPQVFRLLDAIEARYMDMTGLLGIETRQDARLNPALLVHDINYCLLSSELKAGPLIFLFDDPEHQKLALSIFPHYLPLSSLSSSWKVFYS